MSEDRELKARRTADPELNREYSEIVISNPFGEKLGSFLRSKGITIAVKEDSVDSSKLGGDPDLDAVQGLIAAWLKGEDLKKT
jgi:hypothetical protein